MAFGASAVALKDSSSSRSCYYSYIYRVCCFWLFFPSAITMTSPFCFHYCYVSFRFLLFLFLLLLLLRELLFLWLFFILSCYYYYNYLLPHVLISALNTPFPFPIITPTARAAALETPYSSGSNISTLFFFIREKDEGVRLRCRKCPELATTIKQKKVIKINDLTKF